MVRLVSRKPRPTGGVHVVTNRRPGKGREYVTHLLRRSYRDGGKVKSETVGNISYLPEELVEVVRAGLRGEPVGVLSDGFAIERSLPAGHVIAALAVARRLALARLLDRNPSRERDLCIAMILARAVAPASSPAMVPGLTQSPLAEELGLANADADDLYGAMDWLVDRQARIEDRLARRHLASRELALYTVSPWRSETRCRGLAKLGCSRLRKDRTKRIVYGVLCDRPGRPIAVEVFSGGVGDDTTLAPRIAELAARLGLPRLVVCDRAMLTKANHELLRAAESAGRITSLNASEMRRLAIEGALQASSFDEHGLCEITAAAYPDERLVARRDSLVASERAHERKELLATTESGLMEIARGVGRGSLSGADQIGLAIGAVLKGCSVKDLFSIEITDTTFTFARRTDEINAEAALDGIYMLRTSVGESELPTAEVMGSYSQVEQVERAFSYCEDSGLAMRPSPHALEDRVGARAFLCMLAYYLTWHLHRAWGPLLLTDEHPPTPPDATAKTGLCPAAQHTAHNRGLATGEWVHSYGTLLTELASLTRNTIRLPGNPATFEQLSQPTPVQAQALELAEHAPLSA
jgi:hypothetical protein